MSDLWAITCYFNPMGYQRRLANYRVFREHLNVPLITVEWAWSQGVGYQLTADDADVLIQLSSPDLLWQKERLLNIALDALPHDSQYVAWLDCDVVFEDKEWSRRAATMLQALPLIHLFDTAYDAPLDGLAQSPQSPAPAKSLVSVVRALAEGHDLNAVFSAQLRTGGLSSGLAWASRAELARRHGFYDACPAGSGCRAILGAAYGQFDQIMDYLAMTPGWKDHYLRWSRPYYDAVRGRVGCLPGRLRHLWHGDLANRKYVTRHAILRDGVYDPDADLTIDDAGCWRWNSDKPTMHAALRDYFASRREDG